MSVTSRPSLAALALALSTTLPAQAVVLYDATVGLPAGQGWSTLTLGTLGTGALSAGVYTLDSTGSGVDTYGHSRFSPVTLNPTTGWRADFTLRVASEAHSNNNRAGYSMLFVGSDATKSIELAFWGNEVFAYEYVTGAFVHGVGAAVDTQVALRSYSLEVANQQFTLSLEGNVLFGGNLQNYTPQGLPYNLPGFVFFGDNTSSGSSRVEITSFQLASAVPEPATLGLWLAGLMVVSRRVARSSRRLPGLPS